jgi:hypothetical protein
MLRGSGRPVFSTFVVKSRIVLARYFLAGWSASSIHGRLEALS